MSPELRRCSFYYIRISTGGINWGALFKQLLQQSKRNKRNFVDNFVFGGGIVLFTHVFLLVDFLGGALVGLNATIDGGWIYWAFAFFYISCVLSHSGYAAIWMGQVYYSQRIVEDRVKNPHGEEAEVSVLFVPVRRLFLTRARMALLIWGNVCFRTFTLWCWRYSSKSAFAWVCFLSLTTGTHTVRRCHVFCFFLLSLTVILKRLICVSAWVKAPSHDR